MVVYIAEAAAPCDGGCNPMHRTPEPCAWEAITICMQVVLVYIAEAHAADVWPINSGRCAGPANSVVWPRSLDERRAVAARMLEALPCLASRHRLQPHVLVDVTQAVTPYIQVASLCIQASLPLLIDGLDDAFLTAMAAWPIRLFGVRGGAAGLRWRPPSVATPPHCAAFHDPSPPSPPLSAAEAALETQEALCSLS